MSWCQLAMADGLVRTDHACALRAVVATAAALSGSARPPPRPPRGNPGPGGRSGAATSTSRRRSQRTSPSTRRGAARGEFAGLGQGTPEGRRGGRGREDAGGAFGGKGAGKGEGGGAASAPAAPLTRWERPSRERRAAAAGGRARAAWEARPADTLGRASEREMREVISPDLPLVSHDRDLARRPSGAARA